MYKRHVQQGAVQGAREEQVAVLVVRQVEGVYPQRDPDPDQGIQNPADGEGIRVYVHPVRDGDAQEHHAGDVGGRGLLAEHREDVYKRQAFPWSFCPHVRRAVRLRGYQKVDDPSSFLGTLAHLHFLVRQLYNSSCMTKSQG